MPLHGIVISLLTLLAGCGTLELTSHWRAHDVTIDGKNTEWHDSLTTLDDKQTSVGLLNDEQFLYVGLITANPNLQRQIIRQGITFWFDREGGKGKTFGIRYPVGFGSAGQPREERPEEGGKEPDGWAAGVPLPSGELELYGPGDEEHHRMAIAATAGIEVQAHFENSVLVYELKVPLADDGHHPFAIGTKPGAAIGVGVETSGFPSVERPHEGMRENPGGRPGGAGGRGGRSRGAETGGRSAPRSQPEPLKTWAKVQLSTRGASQN